MINQYSRSQLLLGIDSMEKLKSSHVAVFGIGGVGGYVCEALARTGIGAFDLIDDDKVCLTNLNRQIIATRKTIGKYKAEVMKERILEINPNAEVRIHKCFILPENAEDFPLAEYDYVVDAVDTVTAKIELVMKCRQENVPIISSMGAGNKIEASAFKVADIYKTKMCPLAKVMRRELKKRGVKQLKVVYSEEKPKRPIEDMSISCRTHLNFHLIEPQGKYRAEAEKQIAEAGCRTRTDSVRLVEVLFTASPEFFQGKKKKEIKEFFQEALNFLESRQNPNTIISAVVHMDEKTSHMHLSFVPLTEDGRLSAKDIVGNKRSLPRDELSRAF